MAVSAVVREEVVEKAMEGKAVSLGSTENRMAERRSQKLGEEGGHNAGQFRVDLNQPNWVQIDLASSSKSPSLHHRDLPYCLGKYSQLVACNLWGGDEARNELLQALLLRKRRGWCSSGWRRLHKHRSRAINHDFSTVARHDAFGEKDVSTIVQPHMEWGHNAWNISVFVGLYDVVLCCSFGHGVVTVEKVESLCVVVDVVATTSVMEVGEVNDPVVFAGNSKGDVCREPKGAVPAWDAEAERPNSQDDWAGLSDQPGFSQGWVCPAIQIPQWMSTWQELIQHMGDPAT
jgi:hypothetical protein